MSEISCGSKVVKPNGVVTNVTTARMDGYDDDELVEVNAPIRVRVPRECYAESLVALAEEHGFKWREGLEPHVHYPVKKMVEIKIFPEKLDMVGYKYEVTSSCQKLTYAQDLPQIEGWLEYHRESEDECETCGGDKWIKRRVSLPHGEEEVRFPCPNCTDEYEEGL